MNTRPGDLRSTREGLGRARSARVLLSLKRLALVDDVTKLLLPLKWVSGGRDDSNQRTVGCDIVEVSFANEQIDCRHMPVERLQHCN